MKPRIADLFAGIGGATLAFTRTGFKSVFAAEIDPQAADTYEVNHGHRPAGDIAGLDPDAVPDHDVAFIGLPCVGFSTLGWRLGFDDPREAVWFSALRLVARKKPQVVVVENVAGLVRNHGGVALRFVRGCLRAVGYRTSWGMLDATRFGGAQHRRRVFVVASRQRRFDFGLLPVGTTGRIRDILAPQPTDQYLDPSAYRLLARPRPCRTGPVFAGHRTGRPLWRPGGDTTTPALIRDVLTPQATDEFLTPSAYRLLDRPHHCRSGPVFAGYLINRPLWTPGGRLELPRTHGHLSRIYCQSRNGSESMSVSDQLCRQYGVPRRTLTHTNSAGVLRLRPSAIRQWTAFGVLVVRDGVHWLADELPGSVTGEAVSNCS